MSIVSLFPRSIDLELHQLTQWQASSELAFSASIQAQAIALGNYLRQHSAQYPEHRAAITAIGFWLRKSHICQLATTYAGRRPQGCVLHITPANVDTLFMFSWLCAWLMGNTVILRISQTRSPLVDNLLALLNGFEQQADDHRSDTSGTLLSTRLRIISYDHQQHAFTDALSNWCNHRVLWGGDQAINTIRAINPHITCQETTFPDRYSFALIHLADRAAAERAAERCWQDIYMFDQQACASPKVIYWLRTDAVLQGHFWQTLQQLAEQAAWIFGQNQWIDRLSYLQWALASDAGVSLDKQSTNAPEHVLSSACFGVSIPPLSSAVSQDLVKAHCGLGVFLTLSVSTLDDVQALAHCQGVLHFGIDTLFGHLQPSASACDGVIHALQAAKFGASVRRIARLGEALQFHHVWDGVDLLAASSQHND